MNTTNPLSTITRATEVQAIDYVPEDCIEIDSIIAADGRALKVSFGRATAWVPWTSVYGCYSDGKFYCRKDSFDQARGGLIWQKESPS